MFLLDPIKKILAEQRVISDNRYAVCTTCFDSEIRTVLGKDVLFCSWCGCVMKAKTAIPSSKCAHPVHPFW